MKLKKITIRGDKNSLKNNNMLFMYKLQIFQCILTEFLSMVLLKNCIDTL